MRSRTLLLAGLLALGFCGAVPAANAQASLQDAYNYLARTGTIPTADTGNAEERISRGELLQVLLDVREEGRKRATFYRGRLSRLPLFVDVPRDHPLAPYAEAAFSLRITSGFADRTLRPDDPVPAEEAVTLLMRAFRQSGETVEGDRQWFAPFIRAALRKNLVASPRSLAVGQALNRGQLYDMVYRMVVVDRDQLIAYPSPGRGVAMGAAQPVSQPSESGQVFVAQPTGDQNQVREFGSSRDFAITIPSLGIRDLAVAHPSDAGTSQGLLQVLQNGVGHLFSYPGKGGKIMIYGHSSGYAWDVSKYTKIFTQVNKLKSGDKVYVTYNGNVYAYSVTGQQTIAPKDATPFRGEGEELILYTCWPVGSNKSRLIVRAVPVETVAMR